MIWTLLKLQRWLNISHLRSEGSNLFNESFSKQVISYLFPSEDQWIGKVTLHNYQRLANRTNYVDNFSIYHSAIVIAVNDIVMIIVMT